MKECEVDFNPEFMARIIPKLDWPEVVRAAQNLGQLGDTPTELPQVMQTFSPGIKEVYNWVFLRKVVRPKHADVKSLCMQFEKVGRGLLLEGFWSERECFVS